MNWLRSRVGYCAGLGLLAIALQLALSFGHGHFADGSPRRYATLPAQAWSVSSVSSSLAQSLSSTESAGLWNGADRPDDPATDLCPICLTMAMAHWVVFAPPPQLPLPAAFHAVATLPAAEHAPRAAAHLSFWSRGPPLA